MNKDLLRGLVGAGTALAGEQYNRELHPVYVEALNQQAKAFAAQEGISEDEARNRLIVQAYREQDASYDASLNQQGKADDQAALAFMSGKVSGYMDPITNQPIELSYASETERGDPSLYANDLYNDPQARQLVEQATGLSDSALADWARQDYANRESPQYGENVGRWQSNEAAAIVRQTECDFLKFYGQAALTGATGGLSAGVPLLAAANAARDGGITSNVLGYMLASRVGAGLTAGAVNTGSQEIQGKPFHWADAGMATAAGALGVGGGLAWNTAVGAAAGYWQAKIDNEIYSKEPHTDPFFNAITSGLVGASGYHMGNRTTGWLNENMSGKLFPVISGNIAGSSTSEIESYGFDKLNEKSNEGNRGSK